MKLYSTAKAIGLILLMLPCQPAMAMFDEYISAPYPHYGSRDDASPALLRARTLMNALQFSRALNNVVIFADYGSAMTALIDDFRDIFMSRFVQSNPYPSAALPAPRIGDQQAALTRLLTSPAVAPQIGRIIGDAVLRYAAAVLPSKLSDFYMELGGQHLRPGQMVWMNNAQASGLRFFVVPHYVGTSKYGGVRVPTLAEVARNIVETVLVPLAVVPPAMKDEYLKIAEGSVTHAANLAMVRFEARALQEHVSTDLTLLNRAVTLNRWLSSANVMTYDIPAGDLAPIEIGDPHVVRIVTSAVEGLPAILENGQILNSPNWNRKIHAIPSGSGKSTIAGYIQDAYAPLALNSDKTTFQATIIVRGQVGPPAPSAYLPPQNAGPIPSAPAHVPFSVDLPLPQPASPATPAVCSEAPPFQMCNYRGGQGIIMCGQCISNEPK
jgi:hypothetical protein